MPSLMLISLASLLAMTLADPLTFMHADSTWTIELVGDKLHVTADCPETAWCGMGFNKDKPAMDGADVFTFGYHAGVDLNDCPSGNACSSGNRRLRGGADENPYVPRVRDLKLHVPSFSSRGTAQSLQKVGGVVGIALNSVLFVHEHPEEGMTWLFDSCGGHGDTYGHYHYHAPPLCLMSSLGLPVPPLGTWWKDAGKSAWPLKGPEVQIGWALDGAPIMGPFKNGLRTEKTMLDECHGAIDASGEYRYYLLPEAPYMPPCLRGQLGNISSFRSSKVGAPCSPSLAKALETSMLPGGKVLQGNGCPEHVMFQNVTSGQPFGMKVKAHLARKLHNHGNKYGTCPAGGACGCGCGCGAKSCGCGSTSGCGNAACGCGCGSTSGCGAGGACGCGCGTAACGCGTTGSKTARCGKVDAWKASQGCGCGSTTSACGNAACGCGCGNAACGCGNAACGCGCGKGACGCGCGSTSGCGCGCGTTYACKGQMFCAMGLTKKTSTGTPVSLSQCNLQGHSITIDDKQDLTNYSLTFQNGRMKVSAHRALNTGDATDYVLEKDRRYFILLTVGNVGNAIQVGYHGSSATQTLVCASTLSMKGECKEASLWSGTSLEDLEMTMSSTAGLGLSSLILSAWLIRMM